MRGNTLSFGYITIQGSYFVVIYIRVPRIHVEKYYPRNPSVEISPRSLPVLLSERRCTVGQYTMLGNPSDAISFSRRPMLKISQMAQINPQCNKLE